jgi:hypothetical protein
MTEHQNSILALGAQVPPLPATVFDVASGLDNKKIVDCMLKRGFCILRGLFTDDLLDKISDRTDIYLSAPSIAGAPGYWKVDHPKKLVNPFVLGGPALDLLLDERVIDIIEQSMASECILAETILKVDKASSYSYFPLHSDFAVGWAKSDKVPRKLNADDLRQIVGIGGAVYFHDTSDGAFCYCDATHQFMSPHGQQLTQYSSQEQQAILSRKVRCDGRKGDLVLFDDRGFHGPDQPSRADRTVILLDYFRVETIGRLQVSPMPIWSSDIGKLSDKQLRVAGVGADFMVDPSEYAHTRFRRNSFYKLIAWAVTKSYLFDHFKNLIKALLGRI